MSNTDKNNNVLADISYWIDEHKKDKPFTPKENTILKKDNIKSLDTDYFVLSVEDNTTNGMQAMAVAPIVNGKVDTTQITIAYAGTNPGDGKDRQTDLNSVIFGQNYFEQGPDIPTDSQIDSALSFADKVQKQYPHSKFDTTGHSLGGYLGLIVAIKK